MWPELASHLETRSRELGLSTFDWRGTLDQVRDLLLAEIDLSAEQRNLEVAADALRVLRRGAAPGLSWLLALLDRAALEGGTRFAPDLLLFRKSLLTLDGVVRDLAPRYPMGLDVALAGLRHLVKEWPARLLASPTSRTFATHLSNLDLLSLAWLAPARVRNFWLESWRELA